jgi:hypothetical protein
MDPLHFFSKGLSSALWTEIYFFDNSGALHCAINCRHDKMRSVRRFRHEVVIAFVSSAATALHWFSSAADCNPNKIYFDNLRKG